MCGGKEVIPYKKAWACAEIAAVLATIAVDLDHMTHFTW